MAYATLAEVTTFLGESLSAEAEDAAAELLEAASRFVDRVTGRTWVAGTVTAELQQARDGLIRLDRAPVSGVTLVRTRPLSLSASWTTLTSPTGYELINPTEGQILVNASDGAIVEVTYTSNPTVPDDIKAATKMLVAHWVQAAVSPTGLNLSKLKAGSAELTFRDRTDGLPAEVREILNSYTSGLAFA